jgi:hypothetical protein
MDQVTISKYPGGDKEHTHLVKGLVAALETSQERNGQGNCNNLNYSDH